MQPTLRRATKRAINDDAESEMPGQIQMREVSLTARQGAGSFRWIDQFSPRRLTAELLMITKCWNACHRYKVQLYIQSLIFISSLDRMTRIIIMLTMVHELVRTARCAPQRDIYYQLKRPPLFTTPRHVADALEVLTLLQSHLSCQCSYQWDVDNTPAKSALIWSVWLRLYTSRRKFGIGMHTLNNVPKQLNVLQRAGCQHAVGGSKVQSGCFCKQQRSSTGVPLHYAKSRFRVRLVQLFLHQKYTWGLHGHPELHIFNSCQVSFWAQAVVLKIWTCSLLLQADAVTCKVFIAACLIVCLLADVLAVVAMHQSRSWLHLESCSAMLHLLEANNQSKCFMISTLIVQGKFEHADISLLSRRTPCLND